MVKGIVTGLVLSLIGAFNTARATSDFLFEAHFPNRFEQSYPLNFHENFEVHPDSTGTWDGTQLVVDAATVGVRGSQVVLKGLTWTVRATSWKYEQKPFLKISCQNAQLKLNWPEIALDLPNPWAVDLSRPDEGLGSDAVVATLDRALRQQLQPEMLKTQLSFQGDCQGDVAKIVQGFAQAWLAHYPDKESQQYNALMQALKGKLSGLDVGLLITNADFKSLVQAYPIWQGASDTNSYFYRPQNAAPKEKILSAKALRDLQALQTQSQLPFVLVNSTALSTLANQAASLWAAQVGQDPQSNLKVGADGVPVYEFADRVHVSDLQFFLDELHDLPGDTALKIRFVVGDCAKKPGALSALPWISGTGLDAGFYVTLGMNIQLVRESDASVVAERRLTDFLMSWRLAKEGPILDSGSFEPLREGPASCPNVKNLPPEITDSLSYVFKSGDFVSRINNELLAKFRDFMARHVNLHFLGSTNAGSRLATGAYEAEALVLEVQP